MSTNKNSFLENMWLFLIILVIIGFIYNIVEWIIKTIKEKDWISLVIWFTVTYLICLYFDII
jgi:hypothetical protein